MNKLAQQTTALSQLIARKALFGPLPAFMKQADEPGILQQGLDKVKGWGSDIASSAAGKYLSNAWENSPALRYGAYGALGGAGLGLGYNLLAKKKRPLSSVLSGALAGLGLGYGGKTLYDWSQKAQENKPTGTEGLPKDPNRTGSLSKPQIETSKGLTETSITGGAPIPEVGAAEKKLRDAFTLKLIDDKTYNDAMSQLSSANNSDKVNRVLQGAGIGAGAALVGPKAVDLGVRGIGKGVQGLNNALNPTPEIRKALAASKTGTGSLADRMSQQIGYAKGVSPASVGVGSLSKAELRQLGKGMPEISHAALPGYPAVSVPGVAKTEMDAARKVIRDKARIGWSSPTAKPMTFGGGVKRLLLGAAIGAPAAHYGASIPGMSDSPFKNMPILGTGTPIGGSGAAVPGDVSDVLDKYYSGQNPKLKPPGYSPPSKPSVPPAPVKPADLPPPASHDDDEENRAVDR